MATDEHLKPYRPILHPAGVDPWDPVYLYADGTIIPKHVQKNDPDNPDSG